ncbi:MAG: TetR/AcrR family transcriptional regulator [Asticcacaulis sp.]
MASDIFLSEGYASASMSTIAARLGGSKGTLYNYFKSKEELFEAYVRRHCLIQKHEIMSILSVEGEPRQVITSWARRYLTVVTSDQSLNNWRVISAESQKSPEFGRIFYESGPRLGAQILAETLKGWTEQGYFRIADPLVAAQQFQSLISGRIVKARLLGYLPVPTEAEIATEVDNAVATFFAAFGTEKLG